ncbi:MAG: WYL domain-containing transcriptional regulator [Clostridia bacterium]|nr:WYL domain-containing transcriptional regulator [Clostridia bacterium]
MSENGTKLILLKLYELLLKETDEEHPISRNELCRRLGDQGVPCSSRTISRDVALLNESGYEVCSFMQDHEKFYYIPETEFSIPELKILIDSVQAASFITPKKTNQIVDKIAALGGSHRKQLLKRYRSEFNTRKHSNESILYNIDHIESAIQKRKQIAFSYFDLDVNMQRVFRTREDGTRRRYQVEPVALVLSEDNYYLMAFNAKYPGHTSNYRLDRMDFVDVIEDSEISKEALAKQKNVAKYTSQAFRMHNGEQAKVKLQFSKYLIAPIVDKFGESLRMKTIDENTCTATVDVQVSKTFFGWLAQFGTDITITEPERVRKMYLDHLEMIVNKGKEEEQN